jgi:hypothetical protein
MTVITHDRAGAGTTFTSDSLFRAAGLCALIAGSCYVVVGIFHPANVPSSVTTTRWEVVHLLMCAVCFFGVLGMAGLYARQAARTGWTLLAGFLMLELWLVLIMGFSFVEAFLLPHVASSSPALVQAWMGMFNGPAGTFDLGVLPTLWMLTAPIYILGGVCFGVGTFRAGILPRAAGALLALSTLLAPAAAVLPNAAQPTMAIPMGIALAWLGCALWTERRTQPQASASRESATAA